MKAKAMLYYSTNQAAPKVNFKEATMNGLAPDKGLYFPERIPLLDKSFIDTLADFSKEEVALNIIAPYVGDVIPRHELEHIISDTVSFDFPLKSIYENISVLELFHGPTYAFKDVGARFMSRCLSYFVKDHNQKVTVLVATSGDTGGAVANGFYDVEGIDVVILYPSGKISNIQELQLTTLGKNITAIEIDGSFDDCQLLVKQAFADNELRNKSFITSANSINVARWLPQQFYYFFAYQQWKDKRLPFISVPSGNFGNLSAGLLAYKSGLPVTGFIAACNANDVVPIYMGGGEYSPKKSITTISNAMDVGDPSNFVRILEIFKEEPSLLQNILSAYSISDSETAAVIKKVFVDTQYILDPHGAVAYAAMEKHRMNRIDSHGLILETAHPVKFHDVIEPIIGQAVDGPEGISELAKANKQCIKMKNNFAMLKEYMYSR